MKEVQNLEKKLEKATKDSKTPVREREKIENKLKRAYEQLKTSEEQLLTKKLEQAETAADTAGMTEKQKNKANKIAKQTSQNVSAENPSPQQKQQMSEDEARRKKEQDDITRAQNRQATIQGVTQAMSGMYMMMQSIQSLGSIWNNDDLSLGEKLTSTLMSVTMLLGGLSSLMSVYDMIQKKVNKDIGEGASLNLFSAISMGIKAKAAKKAGDAEVKANEKVNASSKKTIITKLAEGWSKALSAAAGGNFAPLILMGVGAAAVATMAGVGLFNIAASKQNNKENAEKSYEDFSKKNEQQKENQGLALEYNNLLKTYEETGEGKDKLAEQAKKLGEAYGIEGAALANLTGDYEQFTKDLNEEIKKQNQIVKNSATSSASALAKVIYDENTLEKGWGGNNNAFLWFNSGTFKDTRKFTLSKTADILENGKFKYITKENDKEVKFEAKTDEESVYMIAEMQRLKDELEKEYTAEELKGDTLYQDIVEKLGQIGQETVNQATESYNAIINSDLSNILLDRKEPVNNLNDFAKLRKDLLENKELGYSEDQIDNFLKSSSQFKEFFEQDQAIREFADQIGYTGKSLEELYNVYQDYGNLIFDSGLVRANETNSDVLITDTELLDYLKNKEDFTSSLDSIKLTFEISDEWEKAAKAGYDEISAFFEKHNIPVSLQTELIGMDPKEAGKAMQDWETNKKIGDFQQAIISRVGEDGTIGAVSASEEAERKTKKQNVATAETELEKAEQVLADEVAKEETKKSDLTNLFSKFNSGNADVYKGGGGDFNDTVLVDIAKTVGVTTEQLEGINKEDEILDLIGDKLDENAESKIGFTATDLGLSTDDFTDKNNSGGLDWNDVFETINDAGNDKDAALKAQKVMDALASYEAKGSDEAQKNVKTKEEELAEAKKALTEYEAELKSLTQEEWIQLNTITSQITEVSQLNKLWNHIDKSSGNYLNQLKKITKENGRQYSKVVEYEKKLKQYGLLMTTTL